MKKGRDYMDEKLYYVETEYNGVRIDKVLSEVFENFSRSKIQKMIEEGNILVNDEKIKANYKCQIDDEIKIVIVEPKEINLKSENIPLDIYYEDDDVIVVNKPTGMVVHPAPLNESGTLVNALMYHVKNLSGINGALRPGIVHRIDKDTSGLLMVAKNDETHVSLSDQLRNKTVKREYLALVHGCIGHERGTIDAPIGRDPKDRTRNVVIKNGKDSITHFQVLERFDKYTLIKCVLETGRTHQIRVHMRYINYPLVGDPKYGPRSTIQGFGQFLHAKTLGFLHPKKNENLEFSAPLPDYMEDFLNTLRKEKSE